MHHRIVPPKLASAGLIVDRHEIGMDGIIVQAHGASPTSACSACALAHPRRRYDPEVVAHRPPPALYHRHPSRASEDHYPGVAIHPLRLPLGLPTLVSNYYTNLTV